MTAEGPVVVCVRGPSRSGKSTVCQALIGMMRDSCHVAWIKRTHHELDLPHKSSGRIWAESPAAMVVYSPDRLQVTIPPVSPEPESLIAALPDETDLVLLETHEFEPYPALVSQLLEPAEGEQVLGRFTLETIAGQAAAFAEVVRGLLPPDLRLARALRIATRAHGGHGCPGIALGTRLTLAAAAELGVALPDLENRLAITVETDRCAIDAVQALTGCTPGKRSLRVLDYGKLGATFADRETGRAIRVAARGDLRPKVQERPGESHAAAQRRTYLELSDEELFSITAVDAALGERRKGPRCRVNCAACGEEVSDGRHERIEGRDYCQPCAAGTGVSMGIERGLTP